MATMSMPIVVQSAANLTTIGIAVEIPEPWAGELQRARQSFGDPQALSIPSHVTLLPPTPVEPSRMDEIDAHLRSVAASLASFELRLAGTDTFRPVSPVVFVRVVVGAQACDALQRLVRTGPLDRQLSFPYHPHVTVAHMLADGALDQAQSTLEDFSASFNVPSFGLFEHGADGVWRPQLRYAFGVSAS